MLGVCWDLEKDVIEGLEKFTCALYGYPRQSNIDVLRFNLLKKKCDVESKIDASRPVDLSSLPPCSATLLQHSKKNKHSMWC